MNRDLEQGVDNDSADHVAAEDCYKEPANITKPSLDKYSVVEENEGDPGKGVARCVKKVEGVVDLFYAISKCGGSAESN